MTQTITQAHPVHPKSVDQSGMIKSYNIQLKDTEATVMEEKRETLSEMIVNEVCMRKGEPSHGTQIEK